MRAIVAGAVVATFVVVAHARMTEGNEGASVVEGTSAVVAPSEMEAPEGVSPLQGGSCGDGRCQPPEDCNSCPQDCGDCCGNRRCEPPEDCRSCPQDCGPCS